MQPESNQFARNGDRNVPSSQQMDLEARYILNPEDRKYYIDMFKSLVRMKHVRLFCRMQIMMVIFLVKKQHAIFLKVVYQRESLISCF